MSTVTAATPQVHVKPDHTQLPEKDGNFVHNFQEHPQSILLSDSILPVLRQRQPNGQFTIGQDCGIYWWHTPDDPLRGCKSPDWFLVPNVPPLLHGRIRRSYVMWEEVERPLLLLEYVSGDGREERDQTPFTGKFWVYERGIQPHYYGIYEVNPGRIEMYHHEQVRFQPMEPNAHGRFAIPELDLELGIWRGRFQNQELPWMRFWDPQGNLLLTGHELYERERQRAERLAEQLRKLGVNPEA